MGDAITLNSNDSGTRSHTHNHCLIKARKIPAAQADCCDLTHLNGLNTIYRLGQKRGSYAGHHDFLDIAKLFFILGQVLAKGSVSRSSRIACPDH